MNFIIFSPSNVKPIDCQIEILYHQPNISIILSSNNKKQQKYKINPIYNYFIVKNITDYNLAIDYLSMMYETDIFIENILNILKLIEHNENLVTDKFILEKEKFLKSIKSKKTKNGISYWFPDNGTMEYEINQDQERELDQDLDQDKEIIIEHKRGFKPVIKNNKIEYIPIKPRSFKKITKLTI